MLGNVNSATSLFCVFPTQRPILRIQSSSLFTCASLIFARSRLPDDASTENQARNSLFYKRSSNASLFPALLQRECIGIATQWLWHLQTRFLISPNKNIDWDERESGENFIFTKSAAATNWANQKFNLQWRYYRCVPFGIRILSLREKTKLIFCLLKPTKKMRLFITKYDLILAQENLKI